VDRELTYQMPFERLRKLGRRSGRKAYPHLWGARWLLLGTGFAALILLAVFDDAVQRWQAGLGLPPLSALVAVVIVYLVVMLALRRVGLRQTQARANFRSDVRLRKDDGGIHIATDDIEYYLKWPGISQMLMEPDGVVVSHGNFFFLIPDSAFADAQERNAFVRDVFERLGELARSRSERSVRSLLNAAAAPARS
jgi:YcxB-like protein